MKQDDNDDDYGLQNGSSSFKATFNPKLIYVFRINDLQHANMVKIGDATLHTDIQPEQLIDEFPDNSHALQQAAKVRIKQYTQTAHVSYDLLYTTLAVYIDQKDELRGFRDHDVHNVLKRSGMNFFRFNDNAKKNEWYQVDLETAQKAIKAVKEGRESLNPKDITHDHSPIIFRPEQSDAIEKAIKRLKIGKRMLWNAKMRFGKTLCALEVVKRCEFHRSIIFTHRPAVNEGWFEDFQKIFYDSENYIYGSKTKGSSLQQLEHSGKNYVYFASIQDLRGSKEAGGKFDKNDEVFGMPWDFAIIDEAHEGTQTTLGENVINLIVHEGTKTLELSGTPFNLIDQFNEDEVYTWDYVMEQKAKQDWRINHYGDYSPYDELPEMQIYTYNLDEVIEGYESEEMAFNFHEFFRTWRDDSGELPIGAMVGDFVHKKDVCRLLELIAAKDENSNYPFSKDSYRLYFRHSLWMVPGVREAKALAELIRHNDAFANFEVVNVAGEGDEEENSLDALTKVRKAIRENEYTITLSCGRLTTGITVPEWTAVFMLSGTFSTSASSYMQTIFRVQSPAKIDGCVKDRCYVFDFAPDRTLKMVAEASRISTRPGKSGDADREQLGEFLNFCPVISVKGSSMKQFDVNHMMRELKKSYVSRVVRNGFDDPHIYNDELLKLTELDIKEFEKLKEIVGSSKEQPNTDDITLNDQGYDKEQYEKLEKAKKKKKKDLTDEEKALLEEHKKKLDSRRKAISILRAISIRIPMLVYGAELQEGENITVTNFAEYVDDQSWTEFMPAGVTKEKFQQFSKYYDRDIFEEAGIRIRSVAKAADELLPMERVKQIARLFSTFKNPDKETVLTPWRVVNMHMSDCLGGWDFYAEGHRDNSQDDDKLDTPRFVDREEVTTDTLGNVDAKILEINSKSGLYPLYCTYSIYRARCAKVDEKKLTEDYRRQLWKQTLAENIFVICKTPMAKSITRRTLLGFEEGKVNAHYFDDLINQIKNKPNNFISKVTKPSYWSINNETMIKFNAIVGNPPYQVMDGGASASATPIYNKFVDISRLLKPNYISMIMPARWYVGGKGLETFRDSMLNDTHLAVLHDFIDGRSCFESVEIKGGICYFLWNMHWNDKTTIYTHDQNSITVSHRYLKEPGENIFIRDVRLVNLKNKIQDKDFKSFSDIVSIMRPYGLRGDFFKDPSKYDLPDIYYSAIPEGITIYGLDDKMHRIKMYIPYDYPLPRRDGLDDYKIFVPRNFGSGKIGDNVFMSIVAKPKEICTETFVQVAPFHSLLEAQNCDKYLKTKFCRILIAVRKQDQGAGREVYHFVPLQNFTSNSDIDWDRPISEIDKELYKKYNLSDDEVNFIESMIKPME